MHKVCGVKLLKCASIDDRLLRMHGQPYEEELALAQLSRGENLRDAHVSSRRWACLSHEAALGQGQDARSIGH